MKRIAAAVAASLLLSACGLTERLWSSGPREISRQRAGALEYRCDANRTLTVLFDTADRSAWVLLPDREFRLDPAPGGGRYTNGRSTLTVAADTLSLEEGAATTHANCKRAAVG